MLWITTDGTWTYGYDDEGNLVAKSKTGESWTYEYDHCNQMTEAEKTVGTTVTTWGYKYDVYGNLVEKELNGSPLKGFAYEITDDRPGFTKSVHTVWSEYNSSGGLAARFLTNGEETVARVDVNTGDVQWLLGDRIGSTRAVTDDAGAVVSEIEYNTFGDIATQTGTDAETGDWLFTGGHYDRDIDIYNMHWRGYSARTGQWLSEDPIGFEAGDMNTRRYVGNNATNGIDRNGLADERTPTEVRGGKELKKETIDLKDLGKLTVTVLGGLDVKHKGLEADWAKNWMQIKIESNKDLDKDWHVLQFFTFDRSNKAKPDGDNSILRMELLENPKRDPGPGNKRTIVYNRYGGTYVDTNCSDATQPEQLYYDVRNSRTNRSNREISIFDSPTDKSDSTWDKVTCKLDALIVRKGEVYGHVEVNIEFVYDDPKIKIERKAMFVSAKITATNVVPYFAKQKDLVRGDKYYDMKTDLTDGLITFPNPLHKLEKK